MEKQLVENIIKAWAKQFNRTMPLKYTITHVNTIYYELKVPNGESVSFTIEEHTSCYRVGVFPSYTVKVSADEPIFSLHEDEIEDFEGYVDDLYDKIASDNYVQWVVNVPFNPPHIRASNECLLEEALDTWMESTGITDDQIVLWYIKEHYLPAFLDQTTKHMANEIHNGVEKFYIEDVVAHWIIQMEEGESIDCLLDEVKEYYKED